MADPRPYRFLVLLTDAYGGQGGIAAFNRNLLDAMCSWEHTELVVGVPVRADMAQEQQSLPDKLVYLDPHGRGGRVSFVLRSLRAWRRHRPFHGLCCGHLFLLRTATLIQGLGRIPMACVLHGIDAWTPPPRASIRACVGRPQTFLVVSEFTLERFLSWSGIQHSAATVLPNCVDLNRFTPGPKPERLVAKYQLSGKRVILTLARLDAAERYKGIDEILQTLPWLLQTVPNLVYVIAGSGTDLPRLQSKAWDLGLGDHVRFVGYIPEEQKEDHYRLADAFVMPGRGEGFGIVYLEAMACGIPVLASTADASREAVRNGQLGCLADPDDPVSVREGILAALGAPTGTRPDGLAHFSQQAFRDRVHTFLHNWMG